MPLSRPNFGTGKGTLHVLNTGIMDMVKAQHDTYEHAVSQKRCKTLPKARGKTQYHEL